MSALSWVFTFWLLGPEQTACMPDKECNPMRVVWRRQPDSLVLTRISEAMIREVLAHGRNTEDAALRNSQDFDNLEAIEKLLELVESSKTELRALDKNLVPEITYGRIKGDIGELESALEQPGILENMPALRQTAEDIREVVRVLQIVHAELSLVSVPEFSNAENLIVALRLAQNRNKQLKKLGSSIADLRTKYSRGYKPNHLQQFSRDLEALAATVKQNAHPFNSVPASTQDFKDTQTQLLDRLGELQKDALGRFPAGDKIEEMVMDVQNSLYRPDKRIKLLYTGFDGYRVEKYLLQKEGALQYISNIVAKMPPIPPSVAPFMGAHRELSRSTDISSLVQNLEDVKIGGNMELLEGRNKIYRSRAPYSKKDKTIALLPQDVSSLRNDANIKRILSLNHVGYSEPSKQILEDGGITLKQLPVSDDHPPTTEQFVEAVTFLQDSNIAGANILVHCGYGGGRTGAVIAAYEVHSVIETWAHMHGAIMPYKDAMTYITERSRFSPYHRLRHGIERIDQEAAVRMYAASLLTVMGASDVPRGVTEVDTAILEYEPPILV